MALSRETEKKQPNEQQSYKGTLLSVGFVAAVILAMWIGVFWIYMIRV
ncbi:cytochrome c oxidase subunit 2A [Aquibacillus kalidii]|nr:cytochrome c oxidase subunit 2A [Aquibacillus kalidii]